MLRRALAPALCAIALTAPAAHAQGNLKTDYAGTALNIVPSGQLQPGQAVAGAARARDELPNERQAQIYDALTPLFRDVPDADLTKYFKSSALDPGGSIVAEERPAQRPGVVIRRDEYGVPHIYGQTDDDVVWGAGWVNATDRNLLLNQARYLGRLPAIDAPNLSAIGLLTDLAQFEPSRKTEDELAGQTKELQRTSAGRAVLRDIDTYVEGSNAWYRQNQPGEKPITRNDIYAANAILGQFFGEGGGVEPRNAELLDSLRDKLGPDTGRGAWDDLRARTDPEASVTTSRSFPYQSQPRSIRGNVVLEKGSYRPVSFTSSRASAAERDVQRNQTASNAVIVGGDRSASGRPLFVAGPQVGYFYPGLTLEVGLHGPNIEFRGATSPPFPGYGLIGRGQDFTWSYTSAGVDIVDTYAETLCDGSRQKYLYKGKCRRMEKFDAGTLIQGNRRTRVVFYKTVHGPVIGYANRANGTKTVAIARKRSSLGRDTTALIFHRALTFGQVKSFEDFKRAAATSPQTFNAFYADTKEFGFYTTGRFPVRPANASSDLPIDGRGSYEWKQDPLASSKHPQVNRPSTGLVINWNNKPAKDFPAGDERFGVEGGIQRNELLEKEVARVDKHTLGSVVGAMNAAATQDIRIISFWPTLKAMLAKGSAPSARERRMSELLDQWLAGGGSRLDRNGDGRIDAQGAAIMDEAFPRLAEAAMCARLGSGVCDRLEDRVAKFDLPPGGQYGGWHQWMDKDLRRILGRQVSGKYNLRYCGEGKASTCATDLWKAMKAAGDALARRSGPDPAGWFKDVGRENIVFRPLPLITMRYTNRPSGIQQVMEFTGERP